MIALLAANPCDTASGCTPILPFWVFAVLFPLAIVLGLWQWWHGDD
jgi:hypothetical protein